MMILFSIVATQAQTLVNREWERLIGVPDTTIDWTATWIDANGDIIIAGNTITAPSETAFLMTKFDKYGNQIWQQNYQHNGNVRNYATAITGDANGNLFITGATSGTNLLFDFLTLQLDASGNIVWAVTYDGTSNLYDIPVAITLDNAGNVLVTGSSFDANSQSDYATVKYDASGTELWVAVYDYANLYDAGVAIETKSNGHVIVTGASASTSNNYDYLTIEYDDTGAQINLNRQNVTGVGLDSPLAMKRDAAGNIYITGKVQNGTNIDIRTIKLDANFALQWAKTYDNVGLTDVGQSIGIDGIGNVYITGYTDKLNGGRDIITLKYDINGNTLWERKYRAEDNTKDAEGVKISIIDIDGEVYICGTIETSAGKDIVTLKYDTDGNTKWAKLYDRSGNADKAIDISVANQDEIYITSLSQDTTLQDKYVVIKYVTYEMPNSIVYDTTQYPIYMDNELIINFHPGIVNTSFVNNKELFFTTLGKVIPDSVIFEMSQKMSGYDLKKNTVVSKVFQRLGTMDSISIARTGDSIPVPEFWSCFVLHFSTNIDELVVIDSLQTLKNSIKYIHANHIYELAGAPDDPLYVTGNFAGFMPTAGILGADINVEPAWDISTGWNNIKVGVYDTGIFWEHEDFGGPTWGNSKVVGGWDWFNNVPINNNLSDPNYHPDIKGHGTICAGLIGALRNNTMGVPGVAGGDGNGNTGVQLFAMRLTDIGNFTTEAKISSAIEEGAHYYPQSNPTGYGLHIMNHSWSGPDAGNLLYDAVKFTHDNSVLFVAASSNEFNNLNTTNLTLLHYPASFPDNWVLKVGANDETGKRADFSRYDNYLDIIAPGTNNLYDCVDNDLTGYTDDYLNGIANGTSFAAPLAAGTAGIMLSHVKNAGNLNGYNQLLPEDFENLMQIYATDVFPTGYDDESGFGRLNAGETMTHIKSTDYKVWHATADVTVGNGFVATPVAQNVPIYLKDISNIYYISGVTTTQYHIIDIYAIDVTVPIPAYIPPNEDIIHAWGTAYSTTMPFPSEDYFFANDRGCDVVSWNSNNITLRGYTYFIKTAYNYSGASFNINLFYPFDPNNPNDVAHFFYTAHTQVNAITSIQNNISLSSTLTASPSIIDKNESKIKYEIPEAIPTEINLYDINGQKVRCLYTGSNQQGCITTDFSDLANGIYIVHLKNNTQSIYTKIVKL